MRPKEVIRNVGLFCVVLLLIWCLVRLADPSRPIEGLRQVFLLSFQFADQKIPGAIDKLKVANSGTPSVDPDRKALAECLESAEKITVWVPRDHVIDSPALDRVSMEASGSMKAQLIDCFTRQDIATSAYDSEHYRGDTILSPRLVYKTPRPCIIVLDSKAELPSMIEIFADRIIVNGCSVFKAKDRERFYEQIRKLVIDAAAENTPPEGN